MGAAAGVHVLGVQPRVREQRRVAADLGCAGVRPDWAGARVWEFAGCEGAVCGRDCVWEAVGGKQRAHKEGWSVGGGDGQGGVLRLGFWV